MEGTPTPQRQRGPESLIDLNSASDLTVLQAGIVTILSHQLPQANVFVTFTDNLSGELQFDGSQSWLQEFLQRHAAIQTKLQHGEFAGITQKELSTPDPAETIPSNVLLVPMISETSLRGIIGVISVLEGKQPSLEELESLRYIAQVAAPIVSRLQEMERLLIRSREFARRLEEAEGHLEGAQKKSEGLEATIRMRAHLQANVAHELRTPLAAIRGYSRMILDGRAGEINDTQKDYLTVITNNTDRLIHLLNWVSHISDPGLLQLTLSTFDLLESWSECVKSKAEPLREKSIALRQQIPHESFVLIGDKERLGNALDALLSSALKFARENSVIVVQFAHGREKDISVKIVSETGDGIPPVVLNHAFDRGVSSGSSSAAIVPRSDTRELNLSAVRDTVGIHGGRIFVTSKAGEGFTFIITLPAVRKDGEERSGHEQAVHSGRRRR
jgi:signal transduction histidine kinase